MYQTCNEPENHDMIITNKGGSPSIKKEEDNV